MGQRAEIRGISRGWGDGHCVFGCDKQDRSCAVNRRGWCGVSAPFAQRHIDMYRVIGLRSACQLIAREHEAHDGGHRRALQQGECPELRGERQAAERKIETAERPGGKFMSSQFARAMLLSNAQGPRGKPGIHPRCPTHAGAPTSRQTPGRVERAHRTQTARIPVD
jgi:hypothetical protein